MRRMLCRCCVCIFLTLAVPSFGLTNAPTDNPRMTVEHFLDAWRNKNSAKLELVLAKDVEATLPRSTRLRGFGQVGPKMSDLIKQSSQTPKVGREQMISANVVIEHLERNWERAQANLVPINITAVNEGGTWRVAVLQLEPATEIDRWNVSGFLGYPINITGRTRFAGPIGKLSICWGWLITSHTLTVDWKDGMTDEGGWTDANGDIVTSHVYRGLGQYAITIHATARCAMSDQVNQETGDAILGTTVANVSPVEIPKGGLKLNPSTVPHGGTSTGTVMITCPAPAWGSTVALKSSNWDYATLEPTMTIQPGQTTGTFAIKANSPGKATITATVGFTTLSAILIIK